MLLPVSPRRAVDLAADQLRAGILGGTFPAGTLLPPERSLAEQLGINRLTLRAALATIQAEGLVHAQQGRGVLVQPWPDRAGIDLIVYIDDIDAIADLLSLRRMLAADAVARTCTRADADTLARLQALAERQQDPSLDEDAFAAGDLAFARRVVVASGSLALRLLFNTVARLYAKRPEVARALLADRALVQQSYPAIVELIRQGDPDAARAAVDALLTLNDGLALGRLRSPEPE